MTKKLSPATKEKNKIRLAQWKKDNPEKVRESVRKWKAAHPDLVRDQHRRHRAKHREERNAYWLDWHAKKKGAP